MGTESTEIRQNGTTNMECSGEGEEAVEPPIPRLHMEGGLQIAKHSTLNENFQSIDRLDQAITSQRSIYEHRDAIGGFEAQFSHTYEPDQLGLLLGVDFKCGLSQVEADVRYDRDGPNKVNEAKAASPWEIFLRQVSNSLTIVLVIIMAISFAIDDYIEGGVISAVILLNIVIGFVQDFRAEQQILSLQALSAPISKVLRDSQLQTIKAENLVQGDIVQLSIGDVVPADLRLFDGINASTDEALLTGESLPIVKTPYQTFRDPSLPIGDRTNLCYAGTTMTLGRATGVVICTGMNTEVGKIAGLLRKKGERKTYSNPVVGALASFKDGVKRILGLTGTPLQVKLSKFALLLFALAMLLVLIVFSANVFEIDSEVLIYAIVVGVAVIPESLIAVLTITVAVGTKAMAQGNVIVRRLAALEAVGGVNHICSDKTGTLTQGKMIARCAWIPGAGTLSVHDTTNPFDPTSGYTQSDTECSIDDVEISSKDCLATFFRAIALCNNSSVYDSGEKDSVKTIPTQESKRNWIGIGEPTEIALQVLAMRHHSGKASILAKGRWNLVAEFGFDSAVKRMTVLYKNGAEDMVEAFTKGATEAIAPLLNVTDTERKAILSRAEAMAAEGLRVLCIARRNFERDNPVEWSARDKAERNLDFLGLVGLYDPPRLETAGSVKACQRAGIVVHMLTGDHVRTATAIACEVGIIPADASEEKISKTVMQAEHFDKLTDVEVDGLPTLPLVIARCSPATKVRMVDALHRRGGFCVMTGDGVNDSPSLKRADVGIAMGLNGSDVAKAAADMILTDDNFASIVKAVEEGRRLFDNIQKFLLHLLISNISQVILLLVGLVFQDQDGYSTFPLSPLEILWVNLITSSFLAIGLGLEEASPDIMLRPPHSLRSGVFTRELITDKFIYGFFMGSLCLVAFASVAYGAGGGKLGLDCNGSYNDTCDVTFRARATAWATLTNLLLVTAWEVKHFSRSLFRLDPERETGRFAVFRMLWRNKFLFWAVVAGFVIAFPVIYLPVVNREVFKHQGISWEWGIVFGCLVVYVGLVESWKAIKRRFGIGSGAGRIEAVDHSEDV